MSNNPVVYNGTHHIQIHGRRIILPEIIHGITRYKHMLCFDWKCHFYNYLHLQQKWKRYYLFLCTHLWCMYYVMPRCTQYATLRYSRIQNSTCLHCITPSISHTLDFYVIAIILWEYQCQLQKTNLGHFIILFICNVMYNSMYIYVINTLHLLLQTNSIINPKHILQYVIIHYRYYPMRNLNTLQRKCFIKIQTTYIFPSV